MQMLHCGCVIANGQMLRHHQSAACAGHAHLTGDDYVLRAAKVYLRSLGSGLLLDASTCDEVLRSVTLYVLSYTGHRKLPHYLNQDGYYLVFRDVARALRMPIVLDMLPVMPPPSCAIKLKELNMYAKSPSNKYAPVFIKSPCVTPHAL